MSPFYLRRVLCLFLICFLFSSNQILFSQEIDRINKEIIYLSPEIFIDTDYTFLNEGINKPTYIKINDSNGEVYITDAGNNCIYIFNSEGKFLNKIGQAGQGPGDLLNPMFLDFDNEGNFYVYESKNKRISILDKEGKYVGGFRLPSRLMFPFTLSNNESQTNVLLNLSHNGYYFTEYSFSGEIVQNIGEISDLNDETPGVNELFAEGWPFKLNNGNYVIFLQHMPIAKIFDKSGNLLKEVEIDFIPEITAMVSSGFTQPKDHHLRGPGSIIESLYEAIVYKNNTFYCMIRHHEDSNLTATIYELDENLNLLVRNRLLTQGFVNFDNYLPNLPLGFDFIDFNDSIVMIHPRGSQLIKFIK